MVRIGQKWSGTIYLNVVVMVAMSAQWPPPKRDTGNKNYRPATVTAPKIHKGNKGSL